MASYIGLVRKDAHSEFGIEFPDFPGCISVGKTLEQVRRNGAEALAFHIDGMLEDRTMTPEPSSMLAVFNGLEGRRDVALVVVDVPDRQSKSVRVNVLLPEDLVRRIDTVSGNRSRFLADAARAKLGEAAA